MSKFSPSGISSTANPAAPVVISGAVNPVTVNVAMASAGTEYTLALPSTTVKFVFKLRGTADVQFAYSAGTTGTTYVTIPRLNFYSESALTPSGVVNLYFQANKPAQVAEVVYWTT